MTALTTRGALAGEWVKLRSIRSTYLTVLISTAVGLFLGLLDYQSAANDYASWPADKQAAFDPVRYGFSGAFYVAILALGTLGTLAASSEYTTGQIRITLLAVPWRGHVLAAKALVVGGLTVALGQILAFGVFALGQQALSAKHLSVGLSDPGVARAVVGSGVFLAVIALLGLALGVIVRRTAGAVAALFGLFFVTPLVFGALGDGPAKFALQSVFEGLGTTVGSEASSTRPGAGMAFAILAGYLVVFLGTAAVLMRRRDA